MLPLHAAPTVAIYCANDATSACPQLRLARPFHHAGWSVRWGTSGDFNQRQIDVDAARGADLVVVQRSLPNAHNHASMRRLAALGLPMAYDLDDSFLDIPASHPNHAVLRPVFPYIRWMLKQADLVTVSTAPLARALQRFTPRPVAVLPNLVDWDWFDAAPRPRGPICRLLVSGTPTHRGDWAVLEQPLVELLAERPGQLKLIFFGDLPARFKGHPSVEAVAFEPRYEHYARQLRELDAHIALVPLADSDFNRAKSSIKWLEYSAAGIPGIYSDIEPYKASVTHGENGLLVERSAAAWKQSILGLIDDPHRTQRLIDNAQHAVRLQHSIAAGLANFQGTLLRLLGSAHATDRRADLALAPARLKSNSMKLIDQYVMWRFRRTG